MFITTLGYGAGAAAMFFLVPVETPVAIVAGAGMATYLLTGIVVDTVKRSIFGY